MTQFTSPVSKAFFKAGEELGYEKIDDGGSSQIGKCILNCIIIICHDFLSPRRRGSRVK